MHALRSARFLARLVLAWFVAVVGVAAAAPAWHPTALDVICTGAGMKLVPGEPGEPGEGEAPGAAALDCPLCITVAPPPAGVQAPHVQPPAGAVPAWPAARAVVAAMPALPARGPPSRSA